MELPELIIVVLCIFLVLWYIVANFYNRRLGITTYNWLRTGIEHYGNITKAEWLGSSGTGGILVVGKANKPFLKVQVNYLLTTREILPWWLITYLRGKRDEIEIKASLRTSPKQEVEVRRVGKQTHPSIQPKDHTSTFERVIAPEGFDIYRYGREIEQELENLRKFLIQEGAGVERISLRRKMPHLVIRARVKPLINRSPESFFANLRTWIE